MSEPAFATLDDVGVREAWAHEALRFTHWLAANLDRLSHAIGIPLELTGAEVRVGATSRVGLAWPVTTSNKEPYRWRPLAGR